MTSCTCTSVQAIRPSPKIYFPGAFDKFKDFCVAIELATDYNNGFEVFVGLSASGRWVFFA